jgi:hypothetical protein
LHLERGLADYVLLKPTLGCGRRNTCVDYVLQSERLHHFTAAQWKFVLVFTLAAVWRNWGRASWRLGRFGNGEWGGCATKQITLSAGLDFIRLRQQVRRVGQTGEFLAGGGISGCSNGLTLFSGTNTFNVALGVQRHLLAQFSDPGLDFRGLWLHAQTLALQRHIGILPLEI